jgi:periplasmic protein CpxP/Spy
MNHLSRTLLKTGVLAALPLTLAWAAQAQPPGPPVGLPPMAEMKAMHEAMQKQRIEDLKVILRLRPDQEPALAAFVADQMPDRMGPEGPDGLTPPPPRALSTPERLADMEKRDAAMASARSAQRQALAKFYAALTPDQQRVFDAAMRLQGGRPGGPDGMGPRIERKVIMHGGPDGPPRGGPH